LITGLEDLAESIFVILPDPGTIVIANTASFRICAAYRHSGSRKADSITKNRKKSRETLNR